MFHEAKKWGDCGKKGIVLRCQENPNHVYYVPYHCDLRICPVCGRRHAQAIRARYREALENLARKGRTRGKSLKLLTLTKKKSEIGPTPESVRDLLKKVGRFVRRFYDGGLCVLEVGPGINLHVHCIVYGPYVPQKELSEAWQAITGDSRVVDIRKVKGRKVPINYILKYIAKPCRSKRPENYVTYLKAIRGTRRVHSYGILYGIKTSKRQETDRRCPACGGTLRYDRELSRLYNLRTLRFHFGFEPYVLSVWRAKVAEA